MEESLGLVQRQKPTTEGKPVVYRGKRYPSQSALALAFDLKPGTFCARLKRKWTFEQAIGYEVAPDKSKIKGRRVRTSLLTKKGMRVFGTFKAAVHAARQPDRLRNTCTPPKIARPNPLNIKRREKSINPPES